MCSGNSLAVDFRTIPRIREWSKIGKVKAIRSNVEQPRLVLNEHRQLCSEFIYRVIELTMQMVVTLDLVVRQFMQEQRVVLIGTRWVVICKVDNHLAEFPLVPFLGTVACKLLAEATLDVIIFVIDILHDHGPVDKFRGNRLDEI